MSLFKLDEIHLLSKIPAENSAKWLCDAKGAINFLRKNAENEEIVIYASTSSVFIHGVLALKQKITPAVVSELQHRDIPMPDDSWRIQQVWGGSKGRRMYLEAPLTFIHKALVGGEKLIFRRRFEGVIHGPTPIELSQKLVHCLDLYFVPERRAYCRLDSRGDIEDVIKVIHRDKENACESIDVVTILRKDLDKFMALSKTCLVLGFDFTRVPLGNFNGWGEIRRFDREEADLCYHGGVDGYGSFCNGSMVVYPQVTVSGLVSKWKAEEDKSKRKYAIFKIYDRKNKVNVETSCAPNCISNYFEISNLPWEISPAFFRPEVLHRFKADPEKYTLEERRISCRNAWYLKTYDINEAGQVHTYIGYLANLPYEEQLYWQSFNEWPKASISKRAHQTDIVGDWYLDHEPLSSLKRTISLLDSNPPDWWKPRGSDLQDAVLLPATDSVKEWANEILALDQLLIEGFMLKPLRLRAERMGCNIESAWGTLRVLQELLSGLGHTVESAKNLISPMQRLHALRTEVRGHATVEKKKAAESLARLQSGNLRSHFENVVSECEQAFNAILQALDVSFKK